MGKEEKITNNIKVPNRDIEVLKKHFPHCFTKNGEFDFEKFKKQLSKNKINFSKESYGLDWLGKSYARLLASDEATTLLKEDEEFNKKEENKNSQNLLIKGDNLEVLKHLSNAYYEKIKMIYIDPPYNTGSDGFVYQDDRKFTIEELSRLAGIDKDKAKRILSFVNSKSNSHSAWLTFMYPRLYIAKQLLREDGVIFVSIDDNEVAQLRLLMDEIFGEESYLTQISVINNLKGRSDDNYFATCNEYLLVYGKSIDDLKISGFNLIEEEIENEYTKIDEFGEYKLVGFRKTGKSWQREHRPKMYYPILEKDGKFHSITKEEYNSIFVNNNFDDKYVDNLIQKYKKEGYNVFLPLNNKKEKGRWRWGFETYNIDKNKHLEINGNNSVSTKMRPFLEDGSLRFKLSKTVWYKGEYDTGSSGKYLQKIFNTTSDYFENPKSVLFVKDVIKISTEQNDLILDFFAGSGTTGDAVMQLNAEDCGNRKYILVQLPEKIDPKKNKTAYDFVKNELGVEEPTIFEITKERLIRAAKKIKEETIKTKITDKQKEIKELESQLDIDGKNEKIKRLKSEIKALKNQDLGFKIFETIPIWEDYNFEAEKFDAALTLFDESKLTEEDLKALLITWKTYDGIPLTESLQQVDLNGYTAYYTRDKLYLINKGFKTKNLKTLLEKIDSDKEFNPTSTIAFGYHFESKNLREIGENIKSYANKKNIDIDFITRY